MSTSLQFPVTMRTAPGITVSDESNNAGKVGIANVNGTYQQNLAPPGTTAIWNNSWRYAAGGMSGTLGTNGTMIFKYVASAEL